MLLKRLSLFLLLLPVMAWGQKQSGGISYTQSSSNYVGTDSLAKYQFLNTITGQWPFIFTQAQFNKYGKLKSDSTANSGYVTHGYFNHFAHDTITGGADTANDVAFYNKYGNLTRLPPGGFYYYQPEDMIISGKDFGFQAHVFIGTAPVQDNMPIRWQDTTIITNNKVATLDSSQYHFPSTLAIKVAFSGTKIIFLSGASNPITISSYQATYAATYGNHPTFVIHEFIGGNDTIINGVQPVLNYTSGLLSSIQFYISPISVNGYILIKP